MDKNNTTYGFLHCHSEHSPALGDAACLKQHEAQKNRIAHGSPYRSNRIAACGDALDEHRIDRNTDQYEHPLKAHGEQGSVFKNTVFDNCVNAVPIIIAVGCILHLFAKSIKALCPGKIKFLFRIGRSKFGQLCINNNAAGVGAQSAFKMLRISCLLYTSLDRGDMNHDGTLTVGDMLSIKNIFFTDS